VGIKRARRASRRPPQRLLPGQTPLDPSDLRGLRDPAIRTRADLNAAEARAIAAPTVKYLAGRPSAKAAPFDVPWMRRLHAEMFAAVWAWAGDVRSRDTNIGVAPHEIEPALNNLALDLRTWRDSRMPWTEQGARLHHRAVWIHPFPNGNGRWARLLANIWLRRHDQPVIMWPEETIGDASVIRGQYLAAVRAADNHDLRPLVALQSQYTSRL
jgi:Fic-DOC domain mobile mystery protein B